MRGVVFLGDRQLELRRFADPVPDRFEAVVEMRASGLCGSDLGMYRGTFSIGTYPRIPGHEVSGVITAAGDGVPDSLNKGDRVALWPYSECGVCPACRQGRVNTSSSTRRWACSATGPWPPVSPYTTARYSPAGCSP